jgi:predicted nucleic acid-binding protein
MSDTLVDANVLLDLVTNDPHFYDWSKANLAEAIRRGRPVVNDVVFAELSVGYQTIDELEAFLRGAGVDVVPMPRLALFLAGKTHQAYRRRGGTRTGVLPDFFIGAHAEIEQLPLLTRDRRRYEAYFPQVKLIAP